jgi:hypothetical protein
LNLTRKRRWLIPAAILGLAFVLWFARRPLEQIVISVRTWQAGIFTPPSLVPDQSQWSRFHEEVQFYWDLQGFAFPGHGA